MTKYFYEETGMFIDWNQMDRLPEIDTLIDIGLAQMELLIYTKIPQSKTHSY